MKKFLSLLLALTSFSYAETALTLSNDEPTLYTSTDTRICSIIVNGPMYVYDFTLHASSTEQGSFTASLSPLNGDASTSCLAVTLSNITANEQGYLTGCTGTLSWDSMDEQSQQALFLFLFGLVDVTNIQMTEAPAFVFNGEDLADSTLEWTASATYDYIRNDLVDEGLVADCVRTDVVVEINHYNVIPEPATATLSLLALAGLAARRRRH